MKNKLKYILLMVIVIFNVNTKGECGMFKNLAGNNKEERIIICEDFRFDEQGHTKEYPLNLNYATEYEIAIIITRPTHQDFGNELWKPLPFDGIVRVSFLHNGQPIGYYDADELWGVSYENVRNGVKGEMGLMSIKHPLQGKYDSNLTVKFEVIKADKSFDDDVSIVFTTFPYGHSKRFPLKQNQ